jgi:hypothetical protein
MQDRRLKQTPNQKEGRPLSLKQAVLDTKARLSQQRSLRVQRLTTSPMRRLQLSSTLLERSTMRPHSIPQQRHWKPRAQMLLKLLVQMRLLHQLQC